MRKSVTRRGLLQGAVALSASVPSLAQAQSAVEVNARPIPSFDPRDASHVRYGSLQYRSGLVLTSPFRGFGGLSGFRIDAKGEQFIALSDKGDWFTGKLTYNGNALAGLSNVQSAPMLGSDGRRITTRGWFDTEALALDGKVAYVGIERANQILRFDLAKGGVKARGEVVPVPDEVSKLPFNKGIEALLFVPREHKPLGGTLIVLSERGLDADGNILGFLIGGASPGTFSVKRSKDYDISDAVLLAAGDVLILERKFSLLKGVGIRIRRVPLASFAPGATIEGPTIFEVDLGYEIDNMEGIDAHVTPSGETVLTMVSDDNFSVIQRNLLLQFTLVDA